MEVANALAYYNTATITTVKSFKGPDGHELKFSPARPDLKRNELSIKITLDGTTCPGTACPFLYKTNIFKQTKQFKPEKRTDMWRVTAQAG